MKNSFEQVKNEKKNKNFALQSNHEQKGMLENHSKIQAKPTKIFSVIPEFFRHDG